MILNDKDLVWLHGELKTSPFFQEARLEAGYLFRELQQGIKLALPQSRPMSNIGRRCHELRVNDENSTWRIVYRTAADAIVILEVFEKKTNTTPTHIINMCKDGIRRYDHEGSQT